MMNSWQDVIKRIKLSTLFDLCRAGIDQCKRSKIDADENIDVRRIIGFHRMVTRRSRTNCKNEYCRVIIGRSIDHRLALVSLKQ